MHRFCDAGKFRPNGHNERARFLDDAPGPPIDVRTAVAHRRLRVESVAHRLDALLPDVIVENEIAEMRMPFEAHAEQVLGFPLVPIRRMNPLDNAGENILRQGGAHQHVHPAGFAFTVKRVTQLPLARTFLDNQTREAEIPLLDNPTAHLGEHRAGARHFAVEVGASKPHCACPGQRRSICSCNSVRFIGV